MPVSISLETSALFVRVIGVATYWVNTAQQKRIVGPLSRKDRRIQSGVDGHGETEDCWLVSAVSNAGKVGDGRPCVAMA